MNVSRMSIKRDLVLSMYAKQIVKACRWIDWSVKYYRTFVLKYVICNLNYEKDRSIDRSFVV